MDTLYSTFHERVKERENKLFKAWKTLAFKAFLSKSYFSTGPSTNGETKTDTSFYILYKKEYTRTFRTTYKLV